MYYVCNLVMERETSKEMLIADLAGLVRDWLPHAQLTFFA